MTYREWVIDKAEELGSDGCTGVSGLYRWCCLEHDALWRLGTRRDGTPITKVEANEVFRSCIQRSSPFGWWSPLAWIRWVGVQWTAHRAERRQMPDSYRAANVTAEDARRRIMHEEGIEE